MLSFTGITFIEARGPQAKRTEIGSEEIQLMAQLMSLIFISPTIAFDNEIGLDKTICGSHQRVDKVLHYACRKWESVLLFLKQYFYCKNS